MDRCIEIQGSMADKLDQPTFRWAHTFVSLRAQIAGDTDRAEQFATGALRSARTAVNPMPRSSSAHSSMIVRGQRGTMNELVPLIEQMATETPDIPRGLFASLLAKAHVEGGHTDQASTC